MEEYCEMPRERRLFYVASELYEDEHPVRLDTVKVKTKGGKQ